MTKIYDQHSAAFKYTQAFVIMYGGERVATIAFKFPNDGAGRLFAYVHFFGVEMVRGWASGGGYDKRSAAVESAVRSMKLPAKHWDNDEWCLWVLFREAVADIGGSNWDRCLESRGFTVLQAV